MEFAPAVAMIALVVVVIDFLKSVTNRNWNAALTQVTVWVGGIVVVLLYAQTVWAKGISIGDQTLDNLNIASIIAVGLAIGSTASLAFIAKKAVDRSDSAVTPSLVPPKTPPAP